MKVSVTSYTNCQASVSCKPRDDRERFRCALLFPQADKIFAMQLVLTHAMSSIDISVALVKVASWSSLKLQISELNEMVPEVVTISSMIDGCRLGNGEGWKEMLGDSLGCEEGEAVIEG